MDDPDCADPDIDNRYVLKDAEWSKASPTKVSDITYDIAQQVGEGLVQVQRLARRSHLSERRGQFGCIAWNAQLAQLLSTSVSAVQRQALASFIDGTDSDATARCSALATHVVATSERLRLSASHLSSSDSPPFLGSGATRVAELLAALVVHGRLLAGTDSSGPTLLGYVQLTIHFRAGVCAGILANAVAPYGVETDNGRESVLVRIERFGREEQERAVSGDAVPPPEALLLVMPMGAPKVPPDPEAWTILQRFVEATSSGTGASAHPLHRMRMHLSRSCLRDGARIVSIFATETASNAAVMDASRMFAHVVFGVDPRKEGAHMELSTLLIKAAIDDAPPDAKGSVDDTYGGRNWDGPMTPATPEVDGGGPPSWVVRGVCSNAVNMFTGLFAAIGQSASAVAYWRLAGWRLDDVSVRTVLRGVHLLELRSAKPASALRRLAGLCLHTQTRLGVLLLSQGVPTVPGTGVSIHTGTLYDMAWTAYTTETWPTAWRDPLSIFRRRLGGGTITLPRSVSADASGLSDYEWHVRHVRELAVMEDGAADETVDATKATQEVEHEKLEQKLIVEFYTVVRDALFTWATHADMSSEGDSAVAREARLHIQTTALERYTEHDPAFLRGCLQAALALTEQRLRQSARASTAAPPPPPSEPDRPTAGHALREAPAYPIVPPFELNQLESANAIRSGAKLVYHVMHAVRLLVTNALWTRVPTVASSAPQSCIDPGRHVALVLVSSTLQMGSPDSTSSTDGAPPFVAFARFLEEETAVAYPPAIDSPFSEVEVEVPELDPHMDPVESLRQNLLPHALLSAPLRRAIINGTVPTEAAVGVAMANALHTAVEARQWRMKTHCQRVMKTVSGLAGTPGTPGTPGVGALDQILRELLPGVSREALLKSFTQQMDAFATELAHKTGTEPKPMGAEATLEQAVAMGIQDGLYSNKVLDEQLGGHAFRNATPARVASAQHETATNAAFARLQPLGWLKARPVDSASGHVLKLIQELRLTMLHRGPCYVQSGFDRRCGTACYLVSWERGGDGREAATPATRARTMAAIAKAKTHAMGVPAPTPDGVNAIRRGVALAAMGELGVV